MASFFCLGLRFVWVRTIKVFFRKKEREKDFFFVSQVLFQDKMGRGNISKAIDSTRSSWRRKNTKAKKGLRCAFAVAQLDGQVPGCAEKGCCSGQQNGGDRAVQEAARGVPRTARHQSVLHRVWWRTEFHAEHPCWDGGSDGVREQGSPLPHLRRPSKAVCNRSSVHVQTRTIWDQMDRNTDWVLREYTVWRVFCDWESVSV